MSRIMGLAAIILLAVLASPVIYIRLAGHDVARWHLAPEPAFAAPLGQITEIPGGAVTRMADGSAALLRMADKAQVTPRTVLLAGSLADGHMTWVTRSRWMAFPDYTTAQILPDGTLAVWARQRYGRGDHGVNAARLLAWQ